MPRKPTGRPPGRPRTSLTERQKRERTEEEARTGLPLDEGWYPPVINWQTLITRQGDPIPPGYEPFAVVQEADGHIEIVSKKRVV